jgi:hypothetical protein
METPTSDLDILFEIGAGCLFFIVTCVVACRMMGTGDGFRICAAGRTTVDSEEDQ